MSDSSQADTPQDSAGPDDIRRNIAAVAAATDTPAPGDGSRLPVVNLSQPISSIARTVGMILHAAPMFRFGEGLSTVDETGEIAPMNPERFTSWVEDHLAFTRPAQDAPRVESIGKDMAGKILAADQFRRQLRELKAVSRVRVPVWKGEGEARTIELAPPGFDTESGLFTVDGVPFADDLADTEGFGFLMECLSEFPFESEGQGKVVLRRSYAAHVAAMLGIFCHALFPEGTARPFIVYNANQPGSGKSLLMRMAVAPVHGLAPESGKSDTEAEFEKTLDAAALARLPFLLLDDCKSIHSQALNRFITSPVHPCRPVHSPRQAMAAKVTQVFATGNGLTVSEDLDRRALVIDLFEPGEARGRSFTREITPAWLSQPETRSRFLASLWALVRRWRDHGMPRLAEHRRGSFEEWSALIGGIVTDCKLCNPFAPREAATGGDESGRALMLVVGLVVGESATETPPVLTTSDVLDRAHSLRQKQLPVGTSTDAQ